MPSWALRGLWRCWEPVAIHRSEYTVYSFLRRGSSNRSEGWMGGQASVQPGKQVRTMMIDPATDEFATYRRGRKQERIHRSTCAEKAWKPATKRKPSSSSRARSGISKHHGAGQRRAIITTYGNPASAIGAPRAPTPTHICLALPDSLPVRRRRCEVRRLVGRQCAKSPCWCLFVADSGTSPERSNVGSPILTVRRRASLWNRAMTGTTSQGETVQIGHPLLCSFSRAHVYYMGRDAVIINM